MAGGGGGVVDGGKSERKKMTDIFYESILKRIARLEKHFRDIKSIVHHWKHYATYRMSGIRKRQKAERQKAQALRRFMKKLPMLQAHFSHKSKGGMNHILLVTGNQARKLRALAEADLRPILNGKNNQGRKDRVVLGQGEIAKKVVDKIKSV